MVPGVDYGEPISYLALEPGAEVISADGQEVGTVKHVLADEEEDVFDGIVIDSKLGPGGLHFVDAPEVTECREKAVLVSINAADVPNLPKPTPNPTAHPTAVPEASADPAYPSGSPAARTRGRASHAPPAVDDAAAP